MRDAKGQIGFYFTTALYHSILDLHGLREVGEACRAALRKFDVQAMAEAIPDALVDEIAIACTPDEARDRLAQWKDLTRGAAALRADGGRPAGAPAREPRRDVRRLRRRLTARTPRSLSLRPGGRTVADEDPHRRGCSSHWDATKATGDRACGRRSAGSPTPCDS